MPGTVTLALHGMPCTIVSLLKCLICVKFVLQHGALHTQADVVHISCYWHFVFADMLLPLTAEHMIYACFRALRQNKEAAALGLLEGHAQQGSRDKDIEVCCFTPDIIPSCHKRCS